MVEREPITVVVSEKGWIRALRGQVADLSSLAFKADDALDPAFFAETTSKLLVFATNGRFYTIEASKLPGGRGHGEPLRLFIDLEQQADIVASSAIRAAASCWSASRQGRGFIVPEDECLANTRKGKQVLNVNAPDAARAIAPVEGELVAAIGENRKMVVFPIDQVPEMARGRGVRLQRHKDGGLSDIKTFEVEKGLTWTDSAGRVFTLSLKELADWRGNRADAGRLAPKNVKRSWKTDETILRIHILQKFGAYRLDQITDQAIAGIVSRHRDAGYASGTTNRVLVLLGLIFNLAKKWGVPGSMKNPTAGFKTAPDVCRERFLTHDEARRLFSHSMPTRMASRPRDQTPAFDRRAA